MRPVKALMALGLLPIMMQASAAWAVTVTKTATLSFGQILGGATGTVTIPNGTGARTGSSILLLNGSQFQQGGAAAFTVTNDTGTTATYTIILITTPADLNNASLPVSAFTLSTTSVSLAPSASVTVYVGATLAVNSSSLSAATYTATSSITLQPELTSG
jgi:Domain of unknown function (DUF4402)